MRRLCHCGHRSCNRADDDEVAQAISVIFFFNILAAVLFPILGSLVGFSTTDGEAFGVFAGTAVNDTSSVTAAAASWDSMWGLGTQTLDKSSHRKVDKNIGNYSDNPCFKPYAGEKRRQKKESSTKKFNFLESFSGIHYLFCCGRGCNYRCGQCGECRLRHLIL